MKSILQINLDTYMPNNHSQLALDNNINCFNSEKKSFRQKIQNN
jgi:hypothetical protein